MSLLLNLQNIKWISVLDGFNVDITGVNDSQAGLVAAAARAASLGAALVFPATGTIRYSEYVPIPPEVPAVYGLGCVLKPTNGTALECGLYFQGLHNGKASNPTRVQVSGLRFDHNTKTGVPIFMDNPQHCRVFDNVMYNLSVASYGIYCRSWLDGITGATGNDVHDNDILSTTNTAGSAGIAFYSESSSASDAETYWKANRTAKPTTVPATFNKIHDNTVEGFQYNIGTTSFKYGEIVDNGCLRGTRGITLQEGAFANKVDSNHVFDCISSAIQVSYDSDYNEITSNTIYTSAASIEGLIQLYIGCDNNKVNTNHIISAGAALPLYHIYVAINSSKNTICDNDLSGPSGRAYIGIESAWNNATTIPYSRYYGVPVGTSNGSNFASAPSNSNRIENNTVDPTNTGPAVVLIQETDATNGPIALNLGHLNGTKVTNDLPTFQLAVYETTASQITDWQCRDNAFYLYSAEAKFSLTRGLAHFKTCTGNTPFNTAVETAFTASATTPSVLYGASFRCANAAPTSITNFTNSFVGQVIRVRLDVNTTLVQGGTIQLKGGVNATGDANSIITLCNTSDLWREICRNY